MSFREVVLAVLIVAFSVFEWWGYRMEKRIEAWACGRNRRTG